MGCISWWSGLDVCMCACTIWHTPACKKGVSKDSRRKTNKYSFEAKKICQELRVSQIAQISDQIIQICLTRTQGKGKNFFIWHFFSFSEHPYRAIWEEGAAVGRIHADVLSASTPHHDPVAAGNEVAAFWLLTQHQPGPASQNMHKNSSQWQKIESSALLSCI